MPAKKTNPKATKNTKPTKVHPALTPAGYVLTGLIMWVAGYLLVILALDSGSLLQWLGALVAVVWGLVRILEGIHLAFKKK